MLFCWYVTAYVLINVSITIIFFFRGIVADSSSSINKQKKIYVASQCFSTLGILQINANEGCVNRHQSLDPTKEGNSRARSTPSVAYRGGVFFRKLYLNLSTKIMAYLESWKGKKTRLVRRKGYRLAVQGCSEVQESKMHLSTRRNYAISTTPN